MHPADFIRRIASLVPPPPDQSSLTSTLRHLPQVAIVTDGRWPREAPTGTKVPLGISMLPGFLCEEGLSSGRLVPLLRNAVQEHVPLFLVHPQGRHMPARVRLLHDFLVEKLRVG